MQITFFLFLCFFQLFWTSYSYQKLIEAFTKEITLQLCVAVIYSYFSITIINYHKKSLSWTQQSKPRAIILSYLKIIQKTQIDFLFLSLFQWYSNSDIEETDYLCVWFVGVLVDMQSSGNVGGGRKCFWGFRSLIQRKQVDSVHVRSEGHHQLARKLSVTDLIAIGKCINLFLTCCFEMGFALFFLLACSKFI